MLMFFMNHTAGNFFVDLADPIIASNFAFPNNGVLGAGISFDSNGDVQPAFAGDQGPQSFSPDPATVRWYTPITTSIGSNFDIRLTVTSGTGPNTGAAIGTWLNLASNRAWGYTSTSSTFAISGNWLIEIRDAVTTSIVANTSFFITLESN